jgi:hypothetical protein
MASPDVLATALVDLAPGYTELFTKWSPIWEKIIAKGQKETLQSYRKEFTVVTGGPGTITNIVGGSEVIAGGRNQTGTRGNEIAPRLIYAFDVPGKDIDEANGEMDFARLIAAYPDLAMADFHEKISTQFCMGNVAEADGFITLNGQETYAPDGSPRTGVFEFAAAASQTSTVFGLQKNTVPGWYNQYGDITSFAGNGRDVMRQVYYNASIKGNNKLKGNVDIMMADALFYNNYISDLDEPVRFAPPANQKGDPAKPDIHQGINFLGATLYLEDKIDPTGFSLAAADGVCYGLHSSTWHMFLVGHGGITQNKGFFSVRPPVKHPTQDLYRYEIVFSMGMYCNDLKSNFVITGGDTP